MPASEGVTRGDLVRQLEAGRAQWDEDLQTLVTAVMTCGLQLRPLLGEFSRHEALTALERELRDAIGRLR